MAESITWMVSGGSVTGTSHRRVGLPCQDSSSYCIAGEVLIAAVADGAGSAALSDVGSTLAAETSVRTAERLLKECHDHTPHPLGETCLKRVVLAAVDETRRVLDKEAERRDAEVGQLGNDTASGSPRKRHPGCWADRRRRNSRGRLPRFLLHVHYTTAGRVC